MCDKRNHPLVEIFRTNSGTYEVDYVVMWCPDCGAVVIDSEVDGRVNPGQVMKMRHPTESLVRRNPPAASGS